MNPTFAIQNMTLGEAWSEGRPTVDHFKIFGCIAYLDVPDEEKNFDAKSEKCVFLRVSKISKAYKLFNLSTLMKIDTLLAPDKIKILRKL